MSEVVLPNPSDHPVRVAQNRIAEAFAARKAAVTNNSAGSLSPQLTPLLERLGWQGTPRQIAEAMPHDTPVEDTDAFRAVLSRLGIDSPAMDVTVRRLRPDHCPCLVVGRDGRLQIVGGVEPDGRLSVLDPLTREWVARRRRTVRGRVHRLLAIDLAQRQEMVQRDGFVWPVLRSFRPRLTAVFWQSCFISLIGLAVSLYVMYVYDKAIGTRSLDTLLMLAIGALVGLALEMWLRQRRAAAIARIAARFDALVACGSLRSVLALSLPMSEGAPLGAQLTRFRQFEIGRELFGGSLATSLIDLPFTLVFFALIFILGGPLGFVPVALAVALAVIGLATDPITAKQMKETGEWKAKSDALLVEITTRMRTIRDNNAEAIWIDRASEIYKRHLSARFQHLQLSNTLQTIAQSLVSCAGVLVLVLGAMEVMDGHLTIGALIAIMAVVWRVLGPIQVVFLSLHRIKMMLQTVRQIEQLMKIRPERTVNRPSSRRLGGAISITNVCLRYGNRSDLALKAVGLTVAPGEFITITGGSGAGKSTLLKAMLGLYPIQTGAIRLDDLDIRQLDPNEMRQSIGFLPQEPTLFFGTVAQNLRLVAPDATNDELVAVLAALGLPPGHTALPDGIETRLSASLRQSLSPAIMQRITLARMFVRDWPILLFDEPSNHLDREGDEALIAAIERLRGRATIIMVTARPSHMRRSDRVVVMHEGQIVGQGKPDEIVPALLSQNAANAVSQVG